MDKDQQELKTFLNEQLEWSRKQDFILQAIEDKLHEMKQLAEYARDHALPPFEIEELNVRLGELTKDVHALEQQFQSIIH